MYGGAVAFALGLGVAPELTDELEDNVVAVERVDDGIVVSPGIDDSVNGGGSVKNANVKPLGPGIITLVVSDREAVLLQVLVSWLEMLGADVGGCGFGFGLEVSLPIVVDGCSSEVSPRRVEEAAGVGVGPKVVDPASFDGLCVGVIFDAVEDTGDLVNGEEPDEELVITASDVVLPRLRDGLGLVDESCTDDDKDCEVENDLIEDNIVDDSPEGDGPVVELDSLDGFPVDVARLGPGEDLDEVDSDVVVVAPVETVGGATSDVSSAEELDSGVKTTADAEDVSVGKPVETESVPEGVPDATEEVIEEPEGGTPEEPDGGPVDKAVEAVSEDTTGVVADPIPEDEPVDNPVDEIVVVLADGPRDCSPDEMTVEIV